MRPGRSLQAAAIVAAASVSALLLAVAPLPFVWIAACWLVCLGWLTVVDRGSTTRAVWFNLGFLVFLLGALEVHAYVKLGSKDDTRFEGSIVDGYYQPHDFLGYGPGKSRQVTSRKYKAGRLLYDVVYSIDASGLRVSPPVASDPDDECAVFFGGSYTFGEGVNDRETMPYAVGELAGMPVFNFGFHGYGPHQMLSAIEHGMVAEVVRQADCEPRHAVYQALVTHAARSAGYSSWDRQGPRYVVSDGGVELAGRFGEPTRGKTIRAQLEKSNLFKQHFDVDRHRVTARDVRLFLGIVEASRAKLAEAYAGIEFHVILWDDDRIRHGRRHRRVAFERIHDGLVAAGIDLHLISDVLPDLSERQASYTISVGNDGHPSAQAHRDVAAYVAERIIGRAAPTSR